jgi:hypothetical protein
LEPNTEVEGVAVGGGVSPSGVFGALPNPNPTGLPNVPPFPDPKPPKTDVGFAVVVLAAVALDAEEPKMLGGAPNRLVVAGLSGMLNGLDGVVELPKRLVLTPGPGSGLISFSFSFSLSLSDAGSLDGEPKVPPPNRDDASLAGAVDFVLKGELNVLAPNGEVGFGAESVESLDEGDDDDEKKSGTFVVEPKADFTGLEDAVGVVLGVGNEKPEVAGAAPSALGVNPPPAGDAAVLLARPGPFPKPAKEVGGAGMAVGVLVVEFLGIAGAPKGSGADEDGTASAFGFSSNSFCTDIRKFL